MRTTRKAVLNLIEALDPDHQSLGWPDPIKWDGRPLKEMAEDMIVLAETEIRDFFSPPEWWTERQRRLVEALVALTGEKY